MNYTIPSDIWNKQASGACPIICTVEIGGIQYIGVAACTKKDVVMKAIQTALVTIQGKSEDCANGTTKYIVVPGTRQGKETEEKPIETGTRQGKETEEKPIETLAILEAKKGGFNKKQNKKRFIKNDEVVNVEKDEAVVPGDTSF